MKNLKTQHCREIGVTAIVVLSRVSKRDTERQITMFSLKGIINCVCVCVDVKIKIHER